MALQNYDVNAMNNRCVATHNETNIDVDLYLGSFESWRHSYSDIVINILLWRRKNA